MFSILSQLSNHVKGLFMMFAGFVLLFHTMGIIQTGLNIIIIIGSILLIIYGFFKADYHKKLFQLLQSTEKKS